jgi:cyanophycinase
VAILPTASRLDDTGPRYERIFSELGAGAVRSLDYKRRDDTDNAEWLGFLREATGIFLSHQHRWIAQHHLSFQREP